MRPRDSDRKRIDRLPMLATVLGCLVAVLVVGALGMLAWSKGITIPREHPGNYFPPGAVSDFEQEWYGKHLFAMEEPVLGAPRADAARGVSELRVLVLPTFGHPAAARYTFDKTATERRAIKLCGAGGYAPGEIGIDDTTTLTPTESAALLASLDASGYWSMPVKDDVWGSDGSEVIIETVRDGERRVRTRWTPEYETRSRGLTAFVAFYSDALKRGGVETKQKVVDPACD